MATLYIMVGIPGAGKTTYAKNKLKHAIRIGSDDLRKEFFGKELTLKGYRAIHTTMCKRAAAHLRNGQDVVIDCMNASIRSRRVYFRILPPKCSIVAIYLHTPVRRALRNNQNRSRHVPMIGILFTRLRLCPPRKSEGFHRVIRYTQTKRTHVIMASGEQDTHQK